MEPVKGGMLAHLPKKAEQILKEAKPDASIVFWTFCFLDSLDGVITNLFGMSTLEQMRDNIKTMSEIQPLSDYEKEVLGKVIRAAWDSGTVPLETIEKYRGLDLPWRVRHGAAGGVQHLPDPAGSEFYG